MFGLMYCSSGRLPSCRALLILSSTAFYACLGRYLRPFRANRQHVAVEFSSCGVMLLYSQICGEDDWRVWRSTSLSTQEQRLSLPNEASGFIPEAEEIANVEMMYWDIRMVQYLSMLRPNLCVFNFRHITNQLCARASMCLIPAPSSIYTF